MKLPKNYARLKKYALLVEEICQDIDLHSYGFEPGVVFCSPNGHTLELPEWFLERLYSQVTLDTQAGV